MGLAGYLTIIVTLPVLAAEDSASPCSAPIYRAFDFWLGSWEVHLADGRRAGRNRIRASSDGCFLQEEWTGAQGGHGHSLNFYDPATEQWRQIWVSPGSIIEISGALEGTSMVLEGQIHYRQPSTSGAQSDSASTGQGNGTEPAPGPTRDFRGRWTPLPDGRVRQFFEEEIEEKWQPWFEGIYSKAVE